MAARRDGMPIKLSEVDELTLGHHPYLQAGDECYYWGEYRVGTGYKGGPTNSLISNIKKSPTFRGSSNAKEQAQYRYKVQAIRTAGQALAGPFRASGGPFTVVPVPPSKMRGDPEHDDRILQVARIMIEGTGSEVRELVRQTESYQASHAVGGAHRLTPPELMAIYDIDDRAQSPRDIVFVLDDVLTMGAHFRAMKDKILGGFPGKRVIGLFIARSVDNPADDFEAL